ncbi:MAG: DNA polymerase III subunit delta [Candidatus Marinimicrobia bacterium]|nr:DNA polymerase III subunit delta [Candidatus Neomarinimicrobiota bacterium]
MSWLSDYEHELTMIKSGKLKPVYFLYGNDYYLRDLAVQSIRQSMNEQGLSFDYGFFNAAELDATELQNLLFGTSLFQSVKCSVVNNVKGLLPSARKIMNGYLQNPEPSNVLILTAEEIEGRNAFYKRIQSTASTLMSNSPFENEIPGWIRQYTAKLNRSIDINAINELIRYVGSDLGKLSNELNKVHIYLPEEQAVTLEDIRKVSGYSKTYSIDQLLEAMGQRNKSAAVAICKNLLENGVSDVYLIIAMYQYIWKLILLKDQRLITSPDLSKHVRAYKPKQLDQLKMVASRFTMSQLRSAVSMLVNADRRIKTSACDPVSNFMITLEGILT